MLHTRITAVNGSASRNHILRYEPAGAQDTAPRYRAGATFSRSSGSALKRSATSP
jgi:hypothetical protein